MSKFNPHDPTHWTAQRLDVPIHTVRELHRAGKLPGIETRNRRIRACYDTPWIAAVERARPQFDTPLAPFLADMRTLLVPRLRAGFAEDAAPNKRLIEFRFFGFGECGESAYPVDRHHRAWRGHRIGVSRDHLLAAHYPQFALLWNPGTNYPTAEASAFRNIATGGYCGLGPALIVEKWCDDHWAHLRAPRADFLERLCDVLELAS